MKIPAGVVAIMCLCQSSAFAQKNFKRAFIVTVSADTVQGYIDYRSWQATPQKITFKKDSSGVGQRYTPADIAAFGVENKLYRASSVTFAETSDNLKNIDENPNFIFSTKTLFLETVFNGPKPLYVFREKNGVSHFFIDSLGHPQPLLYKKYFIKLGAQKMVGVNDLYRNQLANYLKDCIDASAIRETKYQLSSITALFRRYHACNTKYQSFESPKEKIRVNWGVVSGITHTKVSFEGTAQYHFYLYNAKFPYSKNYTGGIFADIELRPKLSLYNDFVYTTYSSHAGYYDTVSTRQHQSFLTEFSIRYLRLNNLVRYYLLKYPDAGGFIAAGVSSGLGFVGKNYTIKDSYFDDNKETIVFDAVRSPRKFEFGAAAGIGGFYKKFSIEFRYQRGNGVMADISKGSNTTTLILLAGYRLSR